MNIYDFDETIFYPNSAWTFGHWSFKRHFPKTVLFFPFALWAAIERLFGIISRDIFNLKLFSFMRFIHDPDAEIKQFWDEHEAQISSWYLNQKSSDDIIISASPDFLIDEIGRRLGVKVIATKMDKRTGKVLGPNCAGNEKVRRLREAYPDAKVKEFYSDSFRDTPMASIAEKSYMVIDKARRTIPWPEKK